MVDSSDDSLAEVLEIAVIKRKTVLLSVHLATRPAGKENRQLLSQLLQRDFTCTTAAQERDNSGAGGCFQLYLVFHKRLGDVMTPSGLALLDPVLHDLGVHSIFNRGIMDLEFSKEAMESHLLNLVSAHDRPEHHIIRKSLLTDLVLHKQQLDEKKKEVLEAINNSKNQSLLHAEDLLHLLKNKEESEGTLVYQIKDTSQQLQLFDEQVRLYLPFADTARVILCTLQRFSATFVYFNISIKEFEKILIRVVVKYKTQEPSTDAMSINAYVLLMKNQLLLNVHKHLQV